MSEKKFNTIRLKRDEYDRPAYTITDKLQNEQGYKEKLQGYKEVSDIDCVNIGTHCRYFCFDKASKGWKFRTGGLLTKKHPKYVVLSNGKHSWSVQREIYCGKNGGDSDETTVYETKFFKYMSNKEKLENQLDKKDIEIEKLKSDNKKLAEKLNLLIANFKSN